MTTLQIFLLLGTIYVIVFFFSIIIGAILQQRQEKLIKKLMKELIEVMYVNLEDVEKNLEQMGWFDES